jgi:hypothetical protein
LLTDHLRGARREPGNATETQTAQAMLKQVAQYRCLLRRG